MITSQRDFSGVTSGFLLFIGHQFISITPTNQCGQTVFPSCFLFALVEEKVTSVTDLNYSHAAQCSALDHDMARRKLLEIPVSQLIIKTTFEFLVCFI